MAIKNYPQAITVQDNSEKVSYSATTKASPKFAYFGNIYVRGCGDGDVDEEFAFVRIPKETAHNTVFLMHIALSTIGPEGGDFDGDDVAFADIYSIGQEHKSDPTAPGSMKNFDLKPDIGSGFGGITEWRYGGHGKPHGMGISTYIGQVKFGWDETTNAPGDGIVAFRLYHQGDCHVGASYFVLELGIQD